MTRAKPVTPYARLFSKVRQFESRVMFPETKELWTYPNVSYESNKWNLRDLYERTKAADQLGYDVRLIAQDDGNLIAQYVKRPGRLDV